VPGRAPRWSTRRERRRLRTQRARRAEALPPVL
jgi:hypothetical protein